MAASLDIVDVEACEVIGELKVDISSRTTANTELKNIPPVICTTYFLKSDLILQIVQKHNPGTDMIEAYIDVLSGPRQSLTFQIKYGFRPFQQLQIIPQLFVYSTTNRRSERYSICPFPKLVEFLARNQKDMFFQGAEFVSTMIIAPTEKQPVSPHYEIPSVNDNKCDHRIIIDGREVRVHKKILMGSSKFFYRRLIADPLCVTTVIDALDEPKRLEIEVLTCILRFMYGLTISDHNLQTASLLCAAREYEVNLLFNVCCNVLIKQLSYSMAPELFYIGKTEKAPRLAFAAAKFILANYRHVKETFEWKACIQAFPTFFETIVPNPLKYFRGIIFPEVRSRSVGDVWSDATLLLTTPEIEPDVIVGRQLQDKTKAEPDTETSSIAGSGSSENTSMLSCDSLDNDFVPMQRKRSSPVVSRRRSDSMGAFSMSSLNDALPKLKFSREFLKKKLLANEPKFDEFGPIESTPSASRPLSRSLSLSDEHSHRSTPDRYDFKFYQPNVDEAMDCREDSNLTSSKSESKLADSMGPGSLSERPDLSTPDTPSLPSMRSLEFGYTYSYSSDSVFERRETPKSMSKVLTPAVDMSVSEIPSDHQHESSSPEIPSEHQDTSVSPKAMKRIDFGMYTHPEARTLSDISSIPLDSSSSVEPESSSSSRSRSRREKRMKKMAEKTRKFLPSNPSNSPFDFTSSEASSGVIPRPTFTKEFHKEKEPSPSKIEQREDLSFESSLSLYDDDELWRKVSFEVSEGASAKQKDAEKLSREENYYQSWIDAGFFLNVSRIFKEKSAARSEHQAKKSEDAEKAWDEKDEEELTANLRKKIGASDIDGKIYEKFKKVPTTSSSESTSRESRIDGGAMRKAPKKFIDDPTPLSSSESVGTTSSSLSSSDHKKVKRTFTDRYSFDVNTELKDQPTIERGKSFVDLRTVRSVASHSQQHRNTPTLAGVYSIGLQEVIPQQVQEIIEIFEEIERGKDADPQQGVEEPNVEIFKEMESGKDEDPQQEPNVEIFREIESGKDEDPQQPIQESHVETYEEVGSGNDVDPQQPVQEPNVEILKEMESGKDEDSQQPIRESNVEIFEEIGSGNDGDPQQCVQEPSIEIFNEMESGKDEEEIEDRKDEKPKSHDENIELETDNDDQKL